jgi:lysophospholipid acyltransferase (LPLAT)-like uncharacterized protein
VSEERHNYDPARKARAARTTGAETASRRRMSAGRKVWYAFVVAVAKGILRVCWKTCRVERTIGSEHLDAIVADGSPAVICYWHQAHIFGSRLMLDLRERGLNVGFLISPSVSGEVPAAMARSWGAPVLRGSPTRTGGQALRDLYLAIAREKISPVITVDGPKGPAFEVKVGAVLLARLAGAPMVPVAWAASRGKYWDSWDRFQVPAPFSRIVYAVGEPLTVPRGTPIDELEPYRLELENRLKAVSRKAREAVGLDAEMASE